MPKNYRIFNYNLNLLPNPHLAALEKNVTDLDEAKARSGLSIGYPGWNLLYYAILSNLHRDGDNIILETGTNFGCSTIILCQALKDSGLHGRIYTVEMDPKNVQRAKENIRKAGLSTYVDLFCQESILFLEDLLKRIDTIRFAFLDGCHDQDHVVREFELIHPRLSDESMVFFDNTYKIAQSGEDQRVNGALKIIKERFGGNLINFENTSWFTPGQAIWQRDAFRKDW